MTFRIDNSDSRPIYIQLMDEIRRAITLGTLRADDSLPSVRQLAEELRINPNTVAQAYRELERAGAVYVRRGQGTFVSHNHDRKAERAAFARDIAARALLEAHRSGVDADMLIAALRSLSRADHPSARAGR